MKFELTAKPTKQLWTNNATSWLYLVEEKQQDREKKWTIFCDQELILESYYNFEGHISESKDKKVKDANGKDIYRATFNANKITSEQAPTSGVEFPF